MFRGPSAGPGRSVVSANNLDREVKGHGNFEKRPGSWKSLQHLGKGFCEIWYRWSIMYPSSPWRGETAASRDDNFRRVPRFIQSSNVQHSQISVAFVTFTHPERILILGSGCKDLALYNVQYNVQGSISRSWQISGQCKQSGSRGERAWKFWKEAGIFRKSLQHLGKGFCEIWYRWSIMYPLSPWRGETAASRDDNFRRVPCISNTPKVPSLLSPSLILKGFWFWDQDARILPCTMFRGPSAGPGRSVVSANKLDREVKGHGKFERPGSFRKVFKSWQRVFVRYDIIFFMMNRWFTMYPSSPWRGETAASRDGNFRRVPCIIQSSNVQHSQISVAFVTFTHPERILILGSGCKDLALYNVQYNAQGSIRRSWHISGQCKQSGSRGEKA